jgi:hypothetical protein
MDDHSSHGNDVTDEVVDTSLNSNASDEEQEIDTEMQSLIIRVVARPVVGYDHKKQNIKIAREPSGELEIAVSTRMYTLSVII